MIAWNPFKRPVQRANLEAWCKLLDDIVKVSLVALPVTAYSTAEILFKTLNLTLLLILVYFCTVFATSIRNYLDYSGESK